MISQSFTLNGLTYYVIIPELDSTYSITSFSPTWTQVCSEGGSYTCPSYDTLCVYGTQGGSYTCGWKTNSVAFTNAVWGDPAQGVNKYGYIITSGNVSINPTPSISYTIHVRRYSASINISPGNYSGYYVCTGSGITYELQAITLPGYKFIGWYNGTNLLTNRPNYTFNLTNNIILKAQFQETPPGLYIKINGHWYPANR